MSKTKKFSASDVSLLEKLRKIDNRLDYIRLPESKTIVEGKPLSEWLQEHAGQGASDYFLLVVLK